MKRLILLGSILGTLVASLVASFVVFITLIWLIYSWYPAPWVVGVCGIGLQAAAIAPIWRWWRLPVERRLRFSLRGMLIGITLLAIWMGVVGVDVLRWGREAAVIRELAGRGVTVNHYLSEDQDWIRTRKLLDRMFGYNPFLKVRDIDIRLDRGLPALLEHGDDFPDLEIVNFWGGGISDAGLERVGELNLFPRLRTGLLDGCTVTDSGLERVHFGRTKVTEDGIQALLRALPDCFVTWEQAFFPAANQVQRIEIWSVAPEESLLATVTELDRIESIMAWLEENHARLWDSSPWHRSTEEHGPSVACLSVRFEGRSRRYCEMRLGNGIYETIWGGYCQMQSADEEGLRALLGVDAAEWSREID